VGTVARIGLTFLCVCAGWVFFRATSFVSAIALLRRLMIPTAGLATPWAAGVVWVTLVAVAVCHLLAVRGAWERLSRRLPAPALGLPLALLVRLALVLAPKGGKPFVYFQF